MWGRRQYEHGVGGCSTLTGIVQGKNENCKGHLTS